MKASLGAKIHNRFDIEVRDKDTGKLKQRGQAENIMLDRMYERICNLNTYFTRIHFGTGTGSLAPSRTTLFQSLGWKNAETEEIIRSFPISRWVQKITLMPEEYVGEKITEVGVSENHLEINTHALIMDVEGNPLKITKGDTDIVVIYAAVFISFSDENSAVTFTPNFNKNLFLGRLLGNNWENPLLLLGSYKGSVRGSIGHVESTYGIDRQADVLNKKVIFTKRVSIAEGNHVISEIGLDGLLRCDVLESNTIAEMNIQGEKIGIGDGERHEFTIRERFKEITVYVDGQEVDDYTLTEATKTRVSFMSILDDTCNEKTGFVEKPFTSDMILYKGYYYGHISVSEGKVIPSKLIGKRIRGQLIRTGQFRDPVAIRIYGSYDDEEYGLIYNRSSPSGSGTATTSEIDYTFQDPFEYIRIEFEAEGANNTNRGRVHNIRLEDPSQEDVEAKIVFNEPLPEGAEVTANYLIDYIPKDENHVLDVEITIQFGEGG